MGGASEVEDCVTGREKSYLCDEVAGVKIRFDVMWNAAERYVHRLACWRKVLESLDKTLSGGDLRRFEGSRLGSSGLSVGLSRWRRQVSRST